MGREGVGEKEGNGEGGKNSPQSFWPGLDRSCLLLLGFFAHRWFHSYIPYSMFRLVVLM